jgi:hypothetical protein
VAVVAARLAAVAVAQADCCTTSDQRRCLSSTGRRIRLWSALVALAQSVQQAHDQSTATPVPRLAFRLPEAAQAVRKTALRLQVDPAAAHLAVLVRQAEQAQAVKVTMVVPRLLHQIPADLAVVALALPDRLLLALTQTL